MKSTKKFGIIGTSCAGKTTLAHAVVSRLKSYGILADGLFSQDRRFSFDISYLESEAAQNWMVSNLIAQEVNLSLRNDVDVLITDRTPLDLYAYYALQYDTPLSQACWGYVKEWMKTYEAVFYLPPLPYQDDNKRPSDEFRLRVDEKLRSLLATPEINIVQVERQHVLTTIMRALGAVKPTVKTRISEDDCQELADTFQLPVLLKISKSDDVLSDSDLWFISPDPTRVRIAAIRRYMRQLFGAYVNFDVGVAHSTRTFDFDYVVKHPRPKRLV